MKKIIRLTPLFLLLVFNSTSCTHTKEVREVNTLNDKLINDSTVYKKALNHSIEEKLLPKYKTNRNTNKNK